MQDEIDKPQDSFGTGWTNEPTLADLKADYDNSKSNHDEQSVKITTWLENLNVKSTDTSSSRDLTNPFSSKGKSAPKGKSTVKPKLIRKQAEWRYTSLTEPFLSTPDIFNVDPVSFEDAESAKQNQLLLNNQFNTRIDKTAFIDEYVRTCVNEGTVIVRVGWISETVTKDVEYPIYEITPLEANSRKLDNLDEAFNADPATLPDEVLRAIEVTKETGAPHWVTEVGMDVISEEVVVKNHPTVEVCEYDNVYIDPSCKGDLEKANFVVYSFETSKSELEKDGRYSNLDKIILNTKSVLSDTDHHAEYAESGFDFLDEPRKRIVAREYWGYWDIDGSGVTKPFVATWVG